MGFEFAVQRSRLAKARCGWSHAPGPEHRVLSGRQCSISIVWRCDSSITGYLGVTIGYRPLGRPLRRFSMTLQRACPLGSWGRTATLTWASPGSPRLGAAASSVSKSLR